MSECHWKTWTNDLVIFTIPAVRADGYKLLPCTHHQNGASEGTSQLWHSLSCERESLSFWLTEALHKPFIFLHVTGCGEMEQESWFSCRTSPDSANAESASSANSLYDEKEASTRLAILSYSLGCIPANWIHLPLQGQFTFKTIWSFVSLPSVGACCTQIWWLLFPQCNGDNTSMKTCFTTKRTQSSCGCEIDLLKINALAVKKMWCHAGI